MYFVYKLTYDTGAAPHASEGLLSLAICKPRIRASAHVGDVIFGFAGRSRAVNRGERLIYIAEVTEKLDAPGEYYERPDFRRRLDCIYDRVGSKLHWRYGSLFHQNNSCVVTDLGPAPVYPRAIVLLSEDFRYFGEEGTLDYAGRWPNLFSFVHECGRGHRVVQPDSAVGRMLSELKRHSWRSWPAGHCAPPHGASERGAVVGGAAVEEQPLRGLEAASGGAHALERCACCTTSEECLRSTMKPHACVVTGQPD
jgi:hypothetical protein